MCKKQQFTITVLSLETETPIEAETIQSILEDKLMSYYINDAGWVPCLQFEVKEV